MRQGSTVLTTVVLSRIPILGRIKLCPVVLGDLLLTLFVTIGFYYQNSPRKEISLLLESKSQALVPVALQNLAPPGTL